MVVTIPGFEVLCSKELIHCKSLTLEDEPKLGVFIAIYQGILFIHTYHRYNIHS